MPRKRKPNYSKIPLETQKRMGRYIPPKSPESKPKAPLPLRPLIWAERRLEAVLKMLQQMALLEILSIIGNVGLIVAVITYVGSEKQRRDAEVLNAWQTLTSAHGQSGSGGRRRALEFLNASPGANWRWRVLPWPCAGNQWSSPKLWSICFTWPRESLAGINLSVDGVESPEDGEEPLDRGPGVYLVGISLPNAYLANANLEGAVLHFANLEGADLGEANLEGAVLWNANLEGTFLWQANLEGAFLEEANLEGAGLGSANLQGARLWQANLEGAFLWQANLGGADLEDANLQGADLGEANLEGAVLWNANLEGAILLRTHLSNAENLTPEQLSKAQLCETELPDHIDLDPNYHCEALRERYPWAFE